MPFDERLKAFLRVLFECTIQVDTDIEANDLKQGFMLVLLTGSDGFIGAALSRDLRQAGHRVVGTCYYRAPGADEFFLDLRDPNSLDKIPPLSFDAVVHAAGMVDQRVPRKLMFAVNAEGTKRLVLWAKANGATHFIYLSSISVYGWKTLGQNRTEDRTRRSLGIPVVPYMGSKVRAECSIENSGLDYTILRLPAVLGKEDSYLSPTIVSALREGTFFTCGTGRRKISLMCVSNLGAIINQVLLGSPANRAFNCCDADVPWKSLVAEYARDLGVDIPKRKRSLFSLLTHLGNKKFLLLLTFSRFGSHFPDTLLHSHIPHTHSHSWQEGVAEAVAGYLTGS
jgi:nucleoside-diphosphate-sugar epimerase